MTLNDGARMLKGISEILHVCGRRGDQPRADRRRHADALLAARAGQRSCVPGRLGRRAGHRQRGRLRPRRQADAATDGTAADTIAWGKVGFGVLFLLLGVRTWRHRPAPGAQHELPKWMAGIDVLKPGKALGLGLLLAGVSPKNLMLAAAAGAGLAELGLSTGDAVGSLIVFVVSAASRSARRSSTTCSAAPARRTRLVGAQGLARHAQRRCDGGPLPRPGLQAHRRRLATTRLRPPLGDRQSRAHDESTPLPRP